MLIDELELLDDELELDELELLELLELELVDDDELELLLDDELPPRLPPSQSSRLGVPESRHPTPGAPLAMLASTS